MTLFGDTYTKDELHTWLIESVGFASDDLPPLPRVGRELLIQRPFPFPAVWRVTKTAQGTYQVRRTDEVL